MARMFSNLSIDDPRSHACQSIGKATCQIRARNEILHLHAQLNHCLCDNRGDTDQHNLGT